MSADTSPPAQDSLSPAGRYLILGVAFLGWLCAGVHMSITQLTGQPAAIDLLARSGELDGKRFRILAQRAKAKDSVHPLSSEDEAFLKRGNTLAGQWFSWFQSAFLFGAATGGLVFGRLGDWVGRSKAMAASIITYAVLAALVTLAQAPWQYGALWFLAGTGVGGMWPTGVALVSEAWAGMSRPVVAGVIGTAANIGLFLMATIGTCYPITPDAWRWAMLVGAAPVVLGVVALFAVPESPRWLAARATAVANVTDLPTTWSVFRPPLLKITLIAILLATIPVIGGWGTANWMNPWADKVGSPFLKAQIGQARAFTGIAGSLLGGWLANHLGRRLTYFLVSLASLVLAQYIFGFVVPTDPLFLAWCGALGFVSGIYFGWLPLCLPELFPTRVRSTGAGVGFNFGRIVTAVTIFATGAVINLFADDYARIGRVTSLLFLLGMIGIWLAPDTGKRELAD